MRSEVKWGQMRSSEVKCQISSNNMKWGQLKSNDVKSGQLRSNEVNWGQVRSNEVNKGKINKNVTVFVNESVTLNVIVIVSWHDVYK